MLVSEGGKEVKWKGRAVRSSVTEVLWHEVRPSFLPPSDARRPREVRWKGWPEAEGRRDCGIRSWVLALLLSSEFSTASSRCRRPGEGLVKGAGQRGTRTWWSETRDAHVPRYLTHRPPWSGAMSISRRAAKQYNPQGWPPAHRKGKVGGRLHVELPNNHRARAVSCRWRRNTRLQVMR